MADQQEQDLYALSDEELQEVTGEVTTSESVEQTPEESPEVVEETTTTESDSTEESVQGDQEQPQDTNNTEESGTTQTEQTSEETQEGKSTEDKAQNDVDYKAFFEHLTKPFKANGKDLQITNPEDIVTLMQQGANYAKKMAAIKPVMRIGKLLEQNELLDESKLSYLIDLHNKKPEAIAKLVKESGIDLYDFDLGKGDSYTPEPRNVSEESFELSQVLDDLKTSQTYNRTINIVGNEWDEASRDVIAKKPHLIKILDAQVQSGVYDQVMQIVEREQILGRMQGLTNLQAYMQVEQQLLQQQQQKPTPNPVVQQKPVVTSQTKQNTTQQKLAASTPRKGVATVKSEFNPLAVSDEEILKMVGI